MRKTYKLSALLKLDLVRHDTLLHGKSRQPFNTWRWWVKIFSPRFLPVLLYRISAHLYQRKCSRAARLFSMLNVVVFGLEISPRCLIGPGLFLPHTHGTVLGAVAIGSNAVIYQGVTLGAKNLDFSYNKAHRPCVGNNVVIGAGAKVLGGIHVGNNAIIGANSVVVKSVAAGQTVAGIPAQVIG